MRHLKLRTICRGGVHKEIGLNGAALYFQGQKIQIAIAVRVW